MQWRLLYPDGVNAFKSIFYVFCSCAAVLCILVGGGGGGGCQTWLAEGADFADLIRKIRRADSEHD